MSENHVNHQVETQSNASLNQNPIAVPYISQVNLLPTGCEIVSATMVLNYYGYPYTPVEIVDRFLKKKELVEHSGQLIGPHPNNFFVGNPYDEDGYGCYVGVIEDVFHKVVTSHKIYNTTNTPIEELENNYIKKGIPVIIWATINLAPSRKGEEWLLEGTEERFQWIVPEHAVVLIGYTDSEYIIHDPLRGTIYVDKALLKHRYKEMGMQSILIMNN